jgi:hypothetical protein
VIPAGERGTGAFEREIVSREKIATTTKMKIAGRVVEYAGTANGGRWAVLRCETR